MPKRVLIFTSEMIPALGYPVAGGSIRTWQIGEGLRSKGHEIIYSIPSAVVEGKNDLPAAIKENAYLNGNLNAIVDKCKPDIVVCIQWHHALKLNNLQIPLVLDLFGLLMLENAYFNEFNAELFSISKMEAFSKADYFICASDKQKAYFFTWMMLAGVDPKADCIVAIPVSLSPQLPKPMAMNEIIMVFGGVFWPWQDPFTPLNEVIKKINQLNNGKLKIFGSIHPYLTNIPLTYPNPEERLIKSSRVERKQMLQHEEMMQEYLKASFAVDLMMPNNERFLAYPIRTVCYLWAGLPVLISDFCDVSLLVKEYNAGWVVNPCKPDEIGRVVEQILNHSYDLTQYKTNAQKLISERLTWDKTIEPLHQYCENPTKLVKNDHMFKQVSHSLLDSYQKLGKMSKEIDGLYEELKIANQSKADLEAIRSKLAYQIYHKLKQTLKGK